MPAPKSLEEMLSKLGSLADAATHGNPNIRTGFKRGEYVIYSQALWKREQESSKTDGIDGRSVTSANKAYWSMVLNPVFAIGLIAAVRAALSPIKYVCENCHTSKDNHNPECQQPDWRPLNPSAALSPVKGDLPDVDTDDPEFSKAAKDVKGARNAGLTREEADRSLYCTLAELKIRERQLRAAHEEIGRLREEISNEIKTSELDVNSDLENALERYEQERDAALDRAEEAERKLETAEAKGQQKGRDECLEAVRGERLECHDKILSRGDLGEDDYYYSKGNRDAERAILALPKAGE